MGQMLAGLSAEDKFAVLSFVIGTDDRCMCGESGYLHSAFKFMDAMGVNFHQVVEEFYVIGRPDDCHDAAMRAGMSAQDMARDMARCGYRMKNFLAAIRVVLGLVPLARSD